MKQGIVSIVVPAYNAGQYISECLESILAQTYPNIEVIVVDDGSRDDTALVVERYCADGRVKLIRTENRGVSAARNTGMDNCNSDGYLMFVDADDRIMPTAVEDMKTEMDRLQADIVDGYAASGIHGQRREKTAEGKLLYCYEDEDSLKRCLLGRAETSGAWAKLYRKSLVEDIRFDEDIAIHEDRLFVFRCALKKPKFATTTHVVYQYNMTAGSASRGAFSEKYLQILTVAERQCQLITDQYPHLVCYLENLKLNAKLVLLRFLEKDHSGKYKKIERQCVREVKKNKKHFRPARKADKKWFDLVVHNLYYACKVRHWLKSKTERRRKK